jgi:MFS family permease
MTAAVRVAANEGHNLMPAPTEPAPRRYIVMLFIAQFIFFVALLGPAIVGLGIKVHSLSAAGGLGMSETGAAAILGGFGALFATVANVVFGRVSDRTTSRLGRRRIWIVLGTVVMTIGFLVMALAPNLAAATVGWALAQLGANITLAPFIATLADQVPHVQRASVASWLGIAQNVGVVGGVYVAQFFLTNQLVMFVVPSLLAIVAMFAFAVVLPDRALPGRPPKLTLRDSWQTFWVSPRQNPDYALAWWSRFLITFASFGFTTFRFFYLLNHVKVPDAQVVPLIANTTLLYTAMLTIAAYTAGKLSDRLDRRKVFVWTSTGLFAIGTFSLIFVTSVPQFFVIEAILGLAYGIYIGVDLALVIDVLPNPDDSAKDLGVFNIANALPQTFAPVIGGILVNLGDPTGNNYPLWFSVCGAAAIVGAIVIFPIKKVR